MITFKRKVVPSLAAAAVAGIAVFGISAPANALEESAPAAGVNDTYEIEVNGTTVTLEANEVATFPLVGVQPQDSSGGISTQGVYVGNWGTLSTWGSGSRFYYSITMTKPATSFSGTAATTNLTNGQYGGIHSVSGFSGSIPTSNLKGHRYSGSVNGAAYNFGVPVASTGPNYTVWVNK